MIGTFGQRTVEVCPDNPAIVKDGKLCSECGHCFAVCQEDIGVAGRDIRACINCGQCTAACPEGALSVRNDVESVAAAVRDPSKVVIFSTSPSVRVGLDDAFGYTRGAYEEGKMVSALRALGGDYVLDVTFSADLTIMEEGTELLGRILNGNAPLPQFTSCCPAWVKFVEIFHPDMIGHLSSAKSPIGMQGAVIKTYFAAKHGIDPQSIVNVAVTPCSAKKAEILRPEFNVAGRSVGRPEMCDNDYVITAKELAGWIKAEGIDYERLPDSDFDSIMGKGTGAGVIFGNTGGVMEAALRMAYTAVEKKPAPDSLLNFEPVRGLEGVKTASVEIGGQTIKTAVIYGTENAEKFMERDDFGAFHFVEVMTCPGGCISGSGQPQGDIIPPPDSLRKSRISNMYAEDGNLPLRNSIDNPEVQQLYREFFSEPGSEFAELMLHTHYYPRSGSDAEK